MKSEENCYTRHTNLYIVTLVKGNFLKNPFCSLLHILIDSL